MSTAAALTVALLCLVPCLAGSGSIEATRRQPDKQLQFLAVSLPLSPLHSIVAIGQELCLRGHNVTVASVGEEGAKKTSKYAPICKLNYLSLGPSPLSKSEISRKIADSIMTTNSTFKQLKTALGLFSAFQSAMEGPMDEALRRGLVKPDFALISLPVGGMARILEKHGVDFAVK